MADLSVNIGKLQMKNPVMTASGTFGYGEEFADFIDITRIGGIIVKGTTLHKREGNPYPRMAETPSGMLNGRMRFLRRRLFGISTDHINKMIMDIRNSSLKDQRTAAKLIHKILQNSPAAVVGNEKLIEENKDLFDEVMKLHS